MTDAQQQIQALRDAIESGVFDSDQIRILRRLLFYTELEKVKELANFMDQFEECAAHWMANHYSVMQMLS